MDDPINDGGPAFPQNDLSGYGMGPAERNNGGMSLRDWFAGQALAGIMAGVGASTWEGDAANAYKVADAMLAARAAK
jgi:hypothetical protein